jgi:S-DNA-T family DNA segregation ATPase FtsK/SpoIIIE
LTQATRAGQLTLVDYLDRAWREAALWALVCAALYLVLALATYSPDDPGWSYVGPSDGVSNAAGRFGAWFADLSLFLFGLFAYLIPVLIAWSAYLLFRQRVAEPETKLYWLALRWSGFLVLLAAGSALAGLHLGELTVRLPNGAGGGLGILMADYTGAAFGASGASLFLTALGLAGFSLFTGLSPLLFVDALGAGVLTVARLPALALRRVSALRLPMPSLSGLLHRGRREGLAQDDGGDVAACEDLPQCPVESGPSEALDFDPALLDAVDLEPRPDRLSGPDRIQAPATVAAADPPTALASANEPQSSPVSGGGLFRRTRARSKTDRRQLPLRLSGGSADLPPLELLDAPRRSARAVSPEQLEAMSRELETRLAEFGVVAEVVEVHPGPVVALFELELAPGLKVSKITGLAKDIARALSKVSVRVVEVIPGKSLIGLEVPNDQREMVVLSETLSSRAYQEAKSPLTLGMGTNIAGEPVVADLGRMPHALIAGTTGSGKSVAINTMILSLLYKSTAEEVRLIMVDPKMLELSVYEGIPHLLTPVVTDMKEAANALRWCVGEMEQRYKLMASLGVRNIAGYNRKVQEAIEAGTPIPDPLFRVDTDGQSGFVPEDGAELPTLAKLPYIVVIIDELADMMMVVGKKVEELIARLAQKARASGIHLLLATQRPSVDVLTGLIKANIPTRMAFKVSARVDSRTVLDQMGAEHLLGYGDMLYLPPGGSIPQRVHGAFVDDHEVHRVVDYLRQQGQPNYVDDILREPSDHLPGIDPEPRGGGDVEDHDPLFDEAVHYVCESRRASISGVQRKLKIGYNRAARMIEEMERVGIVGPAETNGNRDVLAPPPPED